MLWRSSPRLACPTCAGESWGSSADGNWDRGLRYLLIGGVTGPGPGCWGAAGPESFWVTLLPARQCPFVSALPQAACGALDASVGCCLLDRLAGGWELGEDEDLQEQWLLLTSRMAAEGQGQHQPVLPRDISHTPEPGSVSSRGTPETAAWQS